MGNAQTLLLGHFFKTWARHGAAAVAQSQVYMTMKVDVHHIVERGSERWGFPGVVRPVTFSEAIRFHAVRLLEVAKEELQALQWRVFTGDVDLVAPGGAVKGSVDGVADRLGSIDDVALVEVKTRSRKKTSSLDDNASSTRDGCDSNWAKWRAPSLRAAWTHGVLVTLYAASPHRRSESDFARVGTWRRGKPELLLAAPRQAPKRQLHLPARPAPKRRPKKVLGNRSAIKRGLQYATIGTKRSVKVKSYLNAISSTMNAKKAMDAWAHHFGWGGEVWDEMGDAGDGANRNGGSGAYYLRPPF